MIASQRTIIAPFLAARILDLQNNAPVRADLAHEDVHVPLPVYTNTDVRPYTKSSTGGYGKPRAIGSMMNSDDFDTCWKTHLPQTLYAFINMLCLGNNPPDLARIVFGVRKSGYVQGIQVRTTALLTFTQELEEQVRD